MSTALDPRLLGRWTLCEHCDRVGVASELDPVRCTVCAPSHHVRRELADQVYRRVRRAVIAASEVIPSPDSGHIWLFQAPWSAAHLFPTGTDTSLCAKVGLDHPAQLWVDRPARVLERPCRMCETAWMAMHTEEWF